MEDIKQDSINEWVKYLANMHNRSIEMNNMIAYNQFVNEEVRRLQRKTRFLSDDIKSREIISNRVKLENEILQIKNNKLSNENNLLKRKRNIVENTEIDNNYVDNIIVKKPRKYIHVFIVKNA